MFLGYRNTHWNSSIGERSAFGLSTKQLIEVIDTLKQEKCCLVCLSTVSG
jgi:arginine decarboxylase-like protein